MDRIIASEVFINIVEKGSMAAAANAMDMSRSMVTRYLSQMEDWAGARLLHRSTRRLNLTNAGKQVLEHCYQLREVAQEIPVELDMAGSPLMDYCELVVLNTWHKIY